MVTMLSKGELISYPFGVTPCGRQQRTPRVSLKERGMANPTSAFQRAYRDWQCNPLVCRSIPQVLLRMRDE